MPSTRNVSGLLAGAGVGAGVVVVGGVVDVVLGEVGVLELPPPPQLEATNAARHTMKPERWRRSMIMVGPFPLNTGSGPRGTATLALRGTGTQRYKENGY